MSSLNKYAFTPTHAAIALQDFTPNAETFHYDLNVTAHTLTLPSQPFNAAPQASRIAEHAPQNHTAYADMTGDRPQPHPQDFWLLTQHDRTLVKGGLRISLTAIESALIKKMLHHEERVVSKEELIRNIGREPDHYRGLEMCLSRLQEKFKRANAGERLFRAVRNRGYCLTQKIKKPLELSQARR
ncbi:MULTISPECIES: winged helix-turn-helix domain-containing protein [unclassified Pseudomonas]|uniref:winged helix-turn-helix domain-containing protein n=1 Tax=unclassified Pseudomonas TaxID=196821 RepID=UPI0020039881|nr:MULTISPECIES: winged helix-turn-helix domain-containing protein [unclassified Pseudomonas]MCK6190080.1 winged helix-turn-helix domain-containing protein [Pseudomonas sp. EYE_354]WLH70612.1 winged helix-turn-helix domain-containing protein [Pseudomonas sp. FP2309]